MHVPWQAINSPLTLNPELLDEVIKYVHLPKDVIDAYREEITARQEGQS